MIRLPGVGCRKVQGGLSHLVCRAAVKVPTMSVRRAPGLPARRAVRFFLIVAFQGGDCEAPSTVAGCNGRYVGRRPLLPSIQVLIFGCGIVPLRSAEVEDRVAAHVPKSIDMYSVLSSEE